MIKFSLKCSQGHIFESWFASSERFVSLKEAGALDCPHCGGHEIEKTLMSPSVTPRPKSKPEDLRNYLKENSEDVGKRFAAEARAIHEGSAPERQIHGEAKIEEAKALIEDGIPVLPLPIPPKSQTN